MTKKIFAFIISIALILFTSSVFAANNEMKDSMDKAANGVRNVVGGAENVLEDTAGAIGTGVKDLGNTFTDGAARVTRDTTNNNNYTATRTSTARTATNNGTILGMSSGVWTWFVLAIATIAIVGLVWYYAMQHRTEYDDSNN